MGLDANAVKFLLYAQRCGVDLRSTATIGRQSVSFSRSIAKVFGEAGIPMSDSEVRTSLDESDGYCEGLFRKLGAESVTSFDASGYEGATAVHDFNLPIRDDHKARFSVVLDAGTLEHVFNYPVAISNCMEMVCEGGHFLTIAPANNFLGHGFYQFSPELFFGIFGGVNGFEIVDLIFFEDIEGSAWYRVSDPRKAGGRVVLQNSRPSYLLLIAKRVRIEPIMTTFPIQNDYASMWQSGGFDLPTQRSLLSRIPMAAARRIRSILTIGKMKYDPAHFTRFDPLDQPFISSK